ncbi:stage II sporulation protein D [Cohnella sp. GCM10027633]|uniref:stage II sporulation protein D n=1 Tax=unclassified Cohnella TaxID=2636738 RepID=UPI00362B942C
MEGRLRERWGLPSGELKWSVLRTGFAVGAVMAAACWMVVHAGQDTGGKESARYSVDSELQRTAVLAKRESASDEGSSSTAARDVAQRQPAQPQSAVTAAKQQPENKKQAAEAEAVAPADSLDPNVSVYLKDKQSVETVPLETYVLGVVAAEMPLDFEPAALEAQALAARTYIVRRLLADNRDGVPGAKALVTDQVTHQAYLSLANIAELQEMNASGLRKARNAVERTKDSIISYSGEPIEALFFSASNGYTENSEEVFPNKLPYLRAVPSPWDKESVHASEETVTMPLQRFYEKLDVDSLPAIGRGKSKPNVRVLEWTQGRRVKLLLVGSVKITGEEARAKLGLRSASFDVNVANGEVKIKTHGNGHGVGMSQWGAEGMAKAGSDADDIVEHYYTGARVTEASKILKDAVDHT